MAKVKVYKIERYAPSADSETNIPDRWFTRKGAEMVEATRVLEESELEIDIADLDNGAEWTPVGYRPR